MKSETPNQPIELGIVQVVNHYRCLFHIAAGYRRGLSLAERGTVNLDQWELNADLIRELKELQTELTVPAFADPVNVLNKLAGATILLFALTDAAGFSPEALIERGLSKMAVEILTTSKPEGSDGKPNQIV
jgi:hypothetical protein